MQTSLPVIDVSSVYALALDVTAHQRPKRSWLRRPPINFALIDGAEAGSPLRKVCDEIRSACEQIGFFYVTGYPKAQLSTEAALDAEMRKFFSLPLDVKMKIPMSKGGKAWRGYFPVGGELTSGVPDVKEGVYFGEELDRSDLRVVRGLPLFGPNLFPEEPKDVGRHVIDHMAWCSLLGHVLAALLASGLGLPSSYFTKGLLADPLPLFRAFHYPGRAQLPPELAQRADRDHLWGVGEHTDYGLLTLLKQDDVGGLQVKNLEGTWVAAPPIKDTLVVNIGDALEALTHGLLRSTPHRVRNMTTESMRVSLPYFFDPGFSAAIIPLPLSEELLRRAEKQRAQQTARGIRKWDTTLDIMTCDTYGSYLVKKVSKVFPDLAQAKL